MKKWLFLVLMFFLIGCDQEKVTVYLDSDVEAFDEILLNIGNGHTKAYDIRSETSCIDGRIPGFFCMRTVDSEGIEKPLEEIASNLMLLIGNDYNYLIILMDEDGTSCHYLAEILANAGYRNIHYFQNGYESYVLLKGDSFIPEVGECETC
jgi:hypothetical protein